MSHAHFPGSLPFEDAETAMTWVGRTLGDRVRLVPDGETGPQRKGWQPQIPWFESNPTLELMASEVDLFGEGQEYRQWGPKPGVTPSFDEPFEYAQWARDSYRTFARLRGDGVLPQNAKFLVTLPHAIWSVMDSATPEAFDAIYDAFVEQLRNSVAEVVDSVPHEDLAIQWDIPIPGSVADRAAEFGYSDTSRFANRDWSVTEMGLHGGWIPDDVELGFHVCFGDGNQPEHVGHDQDESLLDDDAQKITEGTNEVLAHVDRRVDFLHMPTLAHWLEERHYAPLGELRYDGTGLSIGIINFRRDYGIEQGIERTRQRAKAARAALGDTFGISSTCGLGRYTQTQLSAAAELYDELQS